MNTQLETLQAELAGNEPQLQALLQSLHQLDRYARRMQLLEHEDSMLAHLTTEAPQSNDKAVQADEGSTQAEDDSSRLGLMTSLAEMIDKLEQHVGMVMQAMNRWCLSVLGWELGILAILAGLVTGVAAMMGDGQPLPVLQAWWAELISRPLSLTVYSVLLFTIAAIVHFKLRKIVAGRIANKLQQVELEPFDTSRAFLRNTRIWHSIYRPQPVGWANRAQKQVSELRKQLTDKLAHPQDSQAA
ncbi:MAG: hypothetical protein OEY52_13480 [Gammaproteobacteria bacterium]|nr:hypothetical protein [Gammaproteobacteria bacterium]